MKTIKKAAEAEIEDGASLFKAVAEIIAETRARGEEAVLGIEERFSGARPASFRVSAGSVAAARASLPASVIDALSFAAGRVAAVARAQKDCLTPLDMRDAVGGLEIGHTLEPVARAGCYVPAGRFPLPSSALMSVVTAKTAGVPFVAACSPPQAGSGRIHPAVLAALDIAGADEIYCAGGAQAVAAFAYGAGSLRPVDLVAGPGNRYVTEAKRQLAGTVGIDSLAGPSEVLIIADRSARPDFVACDLLAQSEHDRRAKAVLVALDAALIRQVEEQIEAFLSRKDIDPSGATRQSWLANGEIYLADGLDEAADFASRAAPEHIELQVGDEAARYLERGIRAGGSLFAGHYAPAALGDYVSGTNHILPTAGAARFSSGLWAGTFLRVRFRQSVSKEACAALSGPCMTLAALEGLRAHEESVRIRTR